MLRLIELLERETVWAASDLRRAAGLPDRVFDADMLSLIDHNLAVGYQDGPPRDGCVTDGNCHLNFFSAR